MLTILSYQCGYAQDGSTPILKLEELAGEWFVNMSNFPMWLKGNKTNPRFNYSVVETKGKMFLLDEVGFRKNGKMKSIVGYDKPLDMNCTKYLWRGKGLLKLLKSKWEIIYYDKDEEWILLYFEKTLFTPEGFDVISRKPNISLEIENDIFEVLSDMNIEAPLVKINQLR